MSQDPKELGGPQRVDRTLSLMETYQGAMAGFRRGHPRGIGLRGHFTATSEVAALTTAEHLQGDRIETVVRLSNGNSSPWAGDRKAVLGMGVRFELAWGAIATWAALTIARFPAGTPDAFNEMTFAQRRNKKGQLNPLLVLKHVVTHPNCVPGVLAILKAPTMQSFAKARFNGLHAYYLVDGDGRRHAFRYRWIPAEDFAGLSDEQARRFPPQYLLSEIRQRVAQAPVRWKLVFQMAAPDDPLDDVTKQWPEDRPLVTAGELVLDRVHEDPAFVELLNFDPLGVPPGIEPSDDPILRFRSEAYKESLRRRTSGETRPAVMPE